MADIAKVKRNVVKMIDGGATETEIDAYVKSEGITPRDLRQPVAATPQGPPQPVDVGSDVLNSAGSGLATGVMAIPGAFGDAQSLIKLGGAWLGDRARQITGKPPRDPNVDLGGLPLPTTQDVQNFVTNATGYKPYQSQTTAGQFANTIGNFVPSMALGGGIAGGIRGAAKALVPAVAGGVASEGAGQLTAGTALEPWARGVGALAGGVGAGKMLAAPLADGRAAAVNALKGEGVDTLTGGQMSGSDKLRYMESELGGAKYQKLVDQQQRQFTSAALKRVGENADLATPEVIDRAFTRIGKEFERISGQYDLKFDNKLASDIQTSVNEYENLVQPMFRSPAVQGILNDLVTNAQSGKRSITGKVYQKWRSDIGAAARSATDPEVERRLYAIQHAFDNAFERSIPKASDIAALQRARRQYRNILVIEKAASGAGEAAARGVISPAQLRNATINVFGRRAYARGKTPFDELARSGTEIMKDMPNSGTASRQAARNLMNFGPTVIGGAVGGKVASWPGYALGAIGGAVAPWAVGRALLSKPMRGLIGSKETQAAVARVAELNNLIRQSQNAPASRRPLEITVDRFNRAGQ